MQDGQGSEPENMNNSAVIRLVVNNHKPELIEMLDIATRDMTIAVRVALNLIRAARERAGLEEL